MKVLLHCLVYTILQAPTVQAPVRASTLRRLGAPKPVRSVVARVGLGLEYGSIRRVLDGDTYEVLLPAGLVRIRLRGADAPELSQPYGLQAADSVLLLLRGRLLEVDRTGIDGYGRTLAGLRVAISVTGSNRRWLRVDSLLVARGGAWAYEPGRMVPALAVQQQAQRNRQGLWRCGTTTAVRPAVWRAYNKQEKARAWVGCPGF